MNLCTSSKGERVHSGRCCVKHFFYRQTSNILRSTFPRPRFQGRKGGTRLGLLQEVFAQETDPVGGNVTISLDNQ